MARREEGKRGGERGENVMGTFPILNCSVDNGGDTMCPSLLPWVSGTKSISISESLEE